MVSSKPFDEYLVVEIIVYYPKLLNWTKKKQYPLLSIRY